MSKTVSIEAQLEKTVKVKSIRVSLPMFSNANIDFFMPKESELLTSKYGWEDIVDADAKTFMYRHNSYIRFKEFGIGVLIHEIVHAATNTLHTIGHDFGSNNADEVLAYTIEYIYDEFMKQYVVYHDKEQKENTQ